MFEIDNVTIYILLIAIIPFVWKYIDSIKFGNLEAKFKNSPFDEQLFTFLKGIATHDRFTYYAPRTGEKPIGEAIQTLAERAKDYDYTEFVNMLSAQLKSRNSNQIWFASENIGYFKIAELKYDLTKVYKDLNPNVPWPSHKLNCLWAYSRFENYRELQNFFINTNEINNIKWITDAYIQMAHYHPGELEMILEYILEKRRQLNESAQNMDFTKFSQKIEKLDNAISVLKKS